MQGYFPVQLLGPQAGHEDHGQRRGSHNLVMTSRLTQAGRRPGRHAAKAGHGPVCGGADGPGRELRDGDYSRGASGFWVENGKIAFPVHEITIAGNMLDMLKGIEAVGADAYSTASKTVGSILVNRMKVAGS